MVWGVPTDPVLDGVEPLTHPIGTIAAPSWYQLFTWPIFGREIVKNRVLQGETTFPGF